MIKVGQKLGRLTVVAEAEPYFRSYPRNPNHKTRRFLCRCDCGGEVTVAKSNLRPGHTTSCGCRQREAGKENGRVSHQKHGMCGTPEYAAWLNMIQRCTNPKATRYGRYGGRGIAICEQWLESFDAFYADVGPRPSKHHSIDRINNDGNYEPGNVRWATGAEQQRNRACNRMVEIDGKLVCVADAAKMLGINDSTVRTRIHSGQSPEEALQLRR